MTLEGAANFHETENYVIYTMNSVTASKYCAVLPKNPVGVINMLVDLHMNNSFSEVMSGSKTKESLIEDINLEYQNVSKKYQSCILVMPMIDDGELESIISTDNKQKLFDETKKIGAITSEIYKNVLNSGVDKRNIDQMIIMVMKNENDVKFVEWLKSQMPNFVEGLKYDELVPKVDSNPFTQEVATKEETKPNDIFGNSSANNQDIFASPIPNSEVASNNEEVPNQSNMLDNSATVSMEQTEKVPETINNDFFGGPVSASAAVNPTPTSAVENTVSATSTVDSQGLPNINAVPEFPKPVQSVGLDGTTTFNPINPEQPITSEQSSENAQNEDLASGKGSKGFVNLAIILVVLVVVTFVSIELGKFLYSVYGA